MVRHDSKSSSRHIELVDECCAASMPYFPSARAAVDTSTEIEEAQRLAGMPIGLNDMTIASNSIHHALRLQILPNQLQEYLIGY